MKQLLRLLGKDTKTADLCGAIYFQYPFLKEDVLVGGTRILLFYELISAVSISFPKRGCTCRLHLYPAVLRFEISCFDILS